MSALKNFKQSAGKGALVGLAVGGAAAVVATGIILHQHQKALNLHNKAIMLNTQSILMLTQYTAKSQKSNIV